MKLSKTYVKINWNNTVLQNPPQKKSYQIFWMRFVENTSVVLSEE